MAKKIYFLNRMRKRLDKETKRILYKSLIVSQIDYCSSILFMCNQQQMNSLQVLQNKALRAILNRNRYERVNDMLRDADLLSVQQRVNYNTMKLIYKAEHQRLPSYLCDLFTYVSNVQPYNLRNNNEFRLPVYMSSFTQNSILFKEIQMYNVFKATYQVTPNIEKFKKDLIEFVKTI